MVNFNKDYQRQHSDSEKWNAYPDGVIPMWVADADYAVPEIIIEALKERLSHPVLGYGVESKKLRRLITERMEKCYHWKIKPEWICFVPGVVASLNVCRAIMGDVGSRAITALPVYPHLQNATPILGREMIFYSMVNKNGRFTPDFEELESHIDTTTKMIILCNPHNPVGTVYNEQELRKFAEIAEKYNLLICSDDIHADFALYEDKPYRPIASLSPNVSKHTMTLMAASKTFNIAGLNCSYAIIEDGHLRKQFKTQLKGLVGGVNILGFVASEAAYEYGEDWLTKQLKHLRKNAEYCYQRIQTMPLLSMNKLEATFLAWIDAETANIKAKEKGFANFHEYLLSFGIAVSDGKDFGDENFIRINLATSEDSLSEGLNRLEKAVEELC